MKSTITRDPEEIVDVFNYNIDMLRHLCAEFDSGRTEAALWIAVVLRTLLHTCKKNSKEYSSHALIDQLQEAGRVKAFLFQDTAFPMPTTTQFTQGWRFGDHVCGINVRSSSIYAGLVCKTVNRVAEDSYAVDIAPNLDIWNTEKKHIPFDEWWNKNIVFRDTANNQTLTRHKVVLMVANKDGGSHFDPKVPIEYDTFRHPDLWKVKFDDKKIPFSKNPVHVSVRQIAWEVLQTINEFNN